MSVARSSRLPSPTGAGVSALADSSVMMRGVPLEAACAVAPGCIAMIPSMFGIALPSSTTFFTMSSPLAAMRRAPESLST